MGDGRNWDPGSAGPRRSGFRAGLVALRPKQVSSCLTLYHDPGLRERVARGLLVITFLGSNDSHWRPLGW